MSPIRIRNTEVRKMLGDESLSSVEVATLA